MRYNQRDGDNTMILKEKKVIIIINKYIIIYISSYFFCLIFFNRANFFCEKFFHLFEWSKKISKQLKYPPFYTFFVHSQTNISLHISLPFLTTITLDLFPHRLYNSIQQLRNGKRLAQLLDGIFTPPIPLFKFLVCKSK